MKLSLMWLREHIETDQQCDSWLSQSEEIVRRLARSTAEIERTDHVALDMSRLFLGRNVVSKDGNAVLEVPELSCEITLPARPDSVLHQWYMVFRESEHQYRYATMVDMMSKVAVGKDTMLPAFFIADHEINGGWKKRCDQQDVIITIDNKSINHRPDLWSHYGFAREVAALMGWKLKKPSEEVPVSLTTAPSSYVRVVSSTCERFARFDFESMTKGSLPWMALRLARLDQKPISAFVDTTNYVMFDQGQPLHAFDSSTIVGPLTVRQAHDGEKLALLDGTTVTLRTDDCVVADNNQVLSLAGIKGGSSSGISNQTTHIALEAAYFLPASIRRSSKLHHIRTESSTRFEKGLDKTLYIQGIKTFISILLKEKVIDSRPYSIMIWDGTQEEDAHYVELCPDYLNRKIGIEISKEEVCATLSSLGFVVTSVESNGTQRYKVRVPSFRKSDVNIPEDVIEEVVRMRGYDSLPALLPARSMSAPCNKKSQIARAIRHHIAYGLRMQEVMSYPFFDEDFLQRAHIAVGAAPKVRNPVSEQWQRLVTSLIPNLVSQVTTNLPEEKEVRLFEMAVTWQHEGSVVREARKVAWVWYMNKDIDFYSGKQMVASLLDMLHIQNTWHAATKNIPVWWHAPHTAVVCHGQQEIGLAGMLNPSMLRNVLHGQCFAVELDLDFLQNYVPKRSLYTSISKYPTITTDISMLLSYKVTVEHVLEDIASLHSSITRVFLLDFFEKKTWGDRRSITIRVVCGDQTRTMTHEEVNVIVEQVILRLQEKFGAEIR